MVSIRYSRRVSSKSSTLLFNARMFSKPKVIRLSGRVRYDDHNEVEHEGNGTAVSQEVNCISIMSFGDATLNWEDITSLTYMRITAYLKRKNLSLD